jgi:cell division protein ZapE
LSPYEQWKTLVDSGEFSYDPAQELTVTRLTEVYDHLCMALHDPAPVSVWRKVLKRPKPVAPIKGLYLWGGVGRGKTWLMDVFYDAIPGERKMRMHFHRFMRRVHGDLKRLEKRSDPLVHVADEIAEETKVICFDEFFVKDITDAMLLGRMFQLLFARGITLVATSNIPPEKLYENGLQRRRFLPAIEMIQTHCEVLNVDSDTDYRLRTLSQAELYHIGKPEQTDDALRAAFSQLTANHSGGERAVEIELLGRTVIGRRVHDDVAWFDFDALCNGPRSQHDYIELAKEFHAVILSGVPQLNSQIEDQARRFVYLIDEFYDCNVKLIIAAEVGIHDLYVGEQMQFEFQRTVSRLLEMQSHEYLAQEHRA